MPPPRPPTPVASSSKVPAHEPIRRKRRKNSGSEKKVLKVNVERVSHWNGERPEVCLILLSKVSVNNLHQDEWDRAAISYTPIPYVFPPLFANPSHVIAAEHPAPV